MIMKLPAARAIFLEAMRRCDADVHISATAAFRLAQAMDEFGLALATRALEALGKDNENRRELLRIPERRRLTDDDVEAALEGDG